VFSKRFVVVPERPKKICRAAYSPVVGRRLLVGGEPNSTDAGTYDPPGRNTSAYEYSDGTSGCSFDGTTRLHFARRMSVAAIARGADDSPETILSARVFSSDPFHITLHCPPFPTTVRARGLINRPEPRIIIRPGVIVDRFNFYNASPGNAKNDIIFIIIAIMIVRINGVGRNERAALKIKRAANKGWVVIGRSERSGRARERHRRSYPLEK